MGLFNYLLRRQRRVQSLMDDYLSVWCDCLNAFQDAWETYLTGGLGEEFAFRVEATHKEESKADDVRRKIEHELYAKALLPESRGDILGILETVDVLLTDAERTLYDLFDQKLIVPREMADGLRSMLRITRQSTDRVAQTTRMLFVTSRKPAGLRDIVKEIDSLESEVDHLERSLTRTIFSLPLDTGDKLLLKDLVRRLAAVSDGAERVGDRLVLVNVKRRV